MRIYISKYEIMAGHGSFWEVVSNLWLVMVGGGKIMARRRLS